MADTEARGTPPERDLPLLKVWADYSKDRFESADARVGEYRSGARQLIAAIGVVIVLEVNLLVRLALDQQPALPFALRLVCLGLFILTLVSQFYLLHGLLSVGYIGDPIIGPESPRVLAEYFARGDEAEAHRLTGAYYAKAHDRFHDLSERLGGSLATATRWFRFTLLALLVGVVLMTLGALSGTDGRMADEKPSTPSSAPAAEPAPAAPAPQAQPTNPLTTTPTDGQIMRKSEQGGQVLREEK